MNEGNEGKEYALKEKKEFEEKVLEAIKNLNADGQSLTLNGIQYTYVKGSYTMKFAGTDIEFGLIDQDGKFTYNKENFIEAKKALEEQGINLEELGLPDIEQWIDEQEKLNKEQENNEEKPQEQEKEEEQKDEKDLSDDIEEKDNEEQEKTEEIAKKYNVNSSRVRHLSTTRRVAGRETLPELDSKTKGYKDIYIIPGKDEYSSIMLGIDKDGKEEEIELNRTRGKIPNINIKLITEDRIYDKVKPYEYHEIDSRQGIAKIKDSVGKDEWIYCRQEEGRGKEFQGVIIPEKDTKNIDANPKEVRDAMDYRQNSAYDLAKRGDAFEKAKSLEERGFPSKGGKGVQIEEIKDNPEQNRLLTKEAIINDLAEKAVASSSMPMAKTAYMKLHEKELNQKAERILRIGEEDDDITYEESIKKEAELSKSEKEEKTKEYEGQKLPGQKRGME